MIFLEGPLLTYSLLALANENTSIKSTWPAGIVKYRRPRARIYVKGGGKSISLASLEPAVKDLNLKAMV